MTIICHVCAEFRNPGGDTVFTVEPNRLGCILSNVPEEIRQDRLFDMLAADGSLEAIQSLEKQKVLEADPTAGIDAEGKRKSSDMAKDTVNAKAAPAKGAASKAG